ncbi:MAG: hypothetical protein LBD67_01015 [Candidatus Accumulibacter sp.]|jgi:hypothetical protein|nr:hypothetical protein [Accumulibacter sp.]
MIPDDVYRVLLKGYNGEMMLIWMVAGVFLVVSIAWVLSYRRLSMEGSRAWTISRGALSPSPAGKSGRKTRYWSGKKNDEPGMSAAVV